MGYIRKAFILIDVVLSVCLVTVFTELVIKPKGTESIVGGSAYFNCSTTNPTKEIQWFHYSLGSPDKSMVYGFDDIRGPYQGRFSVKVNNQTGEFNLMISSVELQDAGTYECQDDVGHGDKSLAELIVLVSQPVCQSNIQAEEEVIGPNACGIVLDDLRLSCSVNFKGNNPPVLQWKKIGTSNPLTQGVTHQSSGDRVTYNLTVECDLLTQGSSYVCQTTKSSSPEQHTCSSDVIRVWTIQNDFSVRVVTLGNNVRCSTVNNHSCSYTWTRADPNGETTVSTDQMLKPDVAGLYRCEADCTIKRKSCTVSAMMVHVTEDASSAASVAADTSAESAYRNALIAVIVILIIVVICGVTVVVLYFLCRRKPKPKETNPESKMLLDDSQQKLIEKAKRTDDAEKLLELAQRQWSGEKEILLRRIEECKKEPVGIEYTTNPILIRTIKTQAGQRNGKSIKGLALLNNELFIISQSESDVEVYDSTTFEFRRRWQLNELSNADDAASCVRNRCLYISDSKESGKEILRVDSEGKLIKKWKTDSESGRLSVTEQSTVILIVYESSTLKEYSPDGELIKEINLADCGVIHPMHAIKLPNGNFVVTQGYLSDLIHKLCEVDTDGMVIKSFGSDKGSSNRQLSNPTYLAIDRDGSIMVADASNGRVVLLGSNFEFKREIVSKSNGIQVPTRIRLDELNGRLHVGEYKTGNRCLFVFGIN